MQEKTQLNTNNASCDTPPPVVEFVEMRKDGRVIWVRPVSVEACKNAGWLIFGPPQGDGKVQPEELLCPPLGSKAYWIDLLKSGSCNAELKPYKISVNEDRQSHSPKKLAQIK